MEDLIKLPRVDGADRTRAADPFTDAQRNVEPNGELGTMIQKDVACGRSSRGKRILATASWRGTRN